MLNYVRWIFNIEFCSTPRYVIMRELAMDNKDRLENHEIRAMKDQRRLKKRRDGLFRCWK